MGLCPQVQEKYGTKWDGYAFWTLIYAPEA